MDDNSIRINQLLNTTNVTNTQSVDKTGDDFKFVLASAIEDTELQAKVAELMGDITEMGKRIAKKTDVRDMRRYS